MSAQALLDVLSQAEAQRLAECEAVIEQGEQSFRRVGEALMAVKAEGLYRAYGTFEDYCFKRWNYSKRRTSQLRQAARVVALIEEGEGKPTNGKGTNSTPLHETVARELTPLLAEPGRVEEVWQEAVSKYGDNPTAAQVKEVRGYVWTDSHERELSTVQGHGSHRRAYLLTDRERESLRTQAAAEHWKVPQLKDAVDSLTAGRDKAIHPAIERATASARKKVRAEEERAARANDRVVKACIKAISVFTPKVQRFLEVYDQPEVVARFSPEGASNVADRLDIVIAGCQHLSQALRAKGIW